MSWVRFDDSMPDDEKVINLSDAAFRVYVTAICWSARTLSDGAVPVRKANEIAGRRAKSVMTELVPLLFHEHGDFCTSDACQRLCCLPVGNYLIHNYLKYNPTREAVLEERKAKQEAKSRAGKAGAAARWHGNGRGDGK